MSFGDESAVKAELVGRRIRMSWAWAMAPRPVCQPGYPACRPQWCDQVYSSSVVQLIAPGHVLAYNGKQTREEMSNMEAAEGLDAIVLEDETEFDQVDARTDLERLMEEKQRLQTQLVQVQSMLYLIDSYIVEELLSQVEVAAPVS